MGIRFLTDDNAAVNALKSGDVDVLSPVNATLAKSLDASTYTVSAADGSDKFVLAFNCTNAKLKDKRVRQAIRYAINHPPGCEPLYAKLRPGMKVTIAVDDISLPLPPMRGPDVRERVLEIVLALMADHGVDDIEIIVATGIHRRMKAAEVRHMVGRRVFEAYWPDRLYNHDAEDRDNLVEVATTCLLYTSPSPRDRTRSRMPSSP